MAKTALKYDYDFMSADKVGRFGFKLDELKKLEPKLKLFNKKLSQKQLSADLSFAKLPYETASASQAVNIAKRLVGHYDNLVVVGIGGSDLGARTIYQALQDITAVYSSKGKMALFFLGDTTDPQPLAALLKKINLKRTVFYIVSKSGGTVEPMINFLYLRQQLIKAVGKEKHRQQIIITTNPDKGPLLQISQQENYTLLPHHQVGGRFSVLSINSLLPAACAGFNPGQILVGARDLAKIIQSNDYRKNAPFIFAALHYLGNKKRGQSISVILPYKYSLRNFGLWYRQLIAESLGKKQNNKGQIVNSGITPVAAVGPTDQHSQIQLYNAGPFDKIITFIKVKKGIDLTVPEYQNEEIKYLAGKSFQSILQAEQLATAVSLMKNQRPNGTLILPELNEYYLGQMFYFMELATYYLGELLEINVFDQPGVELSKNYMYGMLGRPGYEKYKKEINEINK